MFGGQEGEKGFWLAEKYLRIIKNNSEISEVLRFYKVLGYVQNAWVCTITVKIFPGGGRLV